MPSELNPRWPLAFAWTAALLLALHSLLLASTAIGISTPIALEGYLASTSWLALAVELSLAIVTWLGFGLPRFSRGVSSSLATVMALGTLSFLLALASYLPCSGDQAPFFTGVSNALAIFLGSVAEPFGVTEGCAENIPLALQAARLGAIFAVSIGIASALAILFRSQWDRVLVHLARELVIVIGYTTESRDILARIVAEMPRNRRVVFLRGNEDITTPTPRVVSVRVPGPGHVLPKVLRGRRRIHSVYVLSPEASEVLSWFHACRAQLNSISHSPVIVLRIDDIWQAEHWRRELISADETWLIDVISPYEQTARMLVDRVIADGTDRMLVVGGSPLRLAIAAEVARRRREHAVARFETKNPPELIFVGPDAELVHRQHLLMQSRFGNIDDVTSVTRDATEAALADLLAQSTQPAIVLTDSDENSMSSASSLAAAHPNWTFYSHESSASGLATTPVMGQLFPFNVRLASSDASGLHVWERAARLLHENYVHDIGLDSGPASKPWDQLSPFYRESNLRMVTTTLASATAFGRTWGASDGPSSGARHGVAEDLLQKFAQREHEQWMLHYLQHGWRYSSARNDKKRTHDRLRPWSELDDESRRRATQGVSDALDVLAALGYRSIDATCSEVEPMSIFRRTGTVTAVRLDDDWEWRAEDGSVMHADAGDWRVSNSEKEWSVEATEFDSTYEHVDGDVWRRTGNVSARRGVLGEEIGTLEGPTRVSEDAWIVQASPGVRWIVPSAHFESNYERA